MMNSEAETKEHAKKLQPLFSDTLHRFDVIVIGYSGEADEAFQILKTARSSRRITWCTFENTAADHVKALIDACGNMGERFEDVDFDEFMIDLAMELKCFPPLLFAGTAQHLKAEIAHIVEPPTSLKGAVGLLADMQQKLEEWHQSETNVERKLRTALLRNDWDAAIALESEVKSAIEREFLAWAFIKKGNALLDRAQLQGEEILFRQSFENYEAALKIKPGDHEALNNWGVALSALARAKNNDEAQLREAISKYKAALKIKPDSHEALNNWGAALAALARARNNDEALFREAISKFEATLKIKPDSHEALNNWGTALAALARAKNNDEALLREAISKYEAALKIKPDRHGVFYKWGVALDALARAKSNDEALFREAISKYEAALKIKPDDHEALYSWGIALADLARAKNNDETLFSEAISKYEAALKIKPDKHEALDNWCTALLLLYHISKDSRLLDEAEAKAKRVEKLSGKAEYNLGCVYALQNRDENCQQQLLRCKAIGTLPDAKHLQADSDLAVYRDRDWFKALLGW